MLFILLLKETLEKTLICLFSATGTMYQLYRSKRHLQRVACKRGTSHERNQSEPPSRRRRSHEQNFEFKKHCIFCGEECLPIDKKNPTRWRQVVQCEMVKQGTENLKVKLMQICDERGDNKANEVRIRIIGAPCDLHASDAQYHKDCYVSFVPKRYIKSASSKDKSRPKDTNENLDELINVMKSDPNYIWTTVDLCENARNCVTKQISH